MAHPDNSKEFLSCVNNDGGFTLLSCPDELLYNKYMDRCDFSIEPLSMGCGSMPCQYGSECIDLPEDKYKCVCAPGYSGVNCEQAPDVCASNPKKFRVFIGQVLDEFIFIFAIFVREISIFSPGKFGQ